MISRIFWAFAGFSFLLACARQTTPNGGPKDVAPPKLESSIPYNNQKNFRGKTLTFTFSEAVKLKDPKEEIIISPEPPKDVRFFAKQNRITIETKAGWKDSTTYSIAFREGVQDITESNPPDNLKIAFSTGPIIDSLNLFGRIVDAVTEKIPQKFTIAIYQSDTFNIFKHAPTYFTKTNKNGRFAISNLKPGAYRIYAFDDKNKNLKVESKTEAFGFYPGWDTIPNHLDTLKIIVIAMDSRPIHLSNVRNSDKSSIVKFNKELVSYSEQHPGKRMINAFGDDHSEIKFFHEIQPDSIPVTLHAADSLEQKLDTMVYIKSTASPGVSTAFKYSQQESIVNSETGVFTTSITFNKPIININPDSIYIKIDSAHNIPIETTNIHYDTANNKIAITRELDKKAITNLINPLQLYLGNAALISIENDSIKRSTRAVTLLRPEDTATLLVEVQTGYPNFEIQLLTENNKIVQTFRNSKKLTFKNLLPATYKLRAYVDKNDNHKWDPGNVYLDLPPEPVFYYKTSTGKFQFPLRANWEVGPYLISF